MPTPLEVTGLSKIYNKKEVVKNISFKVKKMKLSEFSGQMAVEKQLL